MIFGNIPPCALGHRQRLALFAGQPVCRCHSSFPATCRPVHDSTVVTSRFRTILSCAFRHRQQKMPGTWWGFALDPGHFLLPVPSLPSFFNLLRSLGFPGVPSTPIRPMCQVASTVNTAAVRHRRLRFSISGEGTNKVELPEQSACSVHRPPSTCINSPLLSRLQEIFSFPLFSSYLPWLASGRSRNPGVHLRGRHCTSFCLPLVEASSGVHGRNF